MRYIDENGVHVLVWATCRLALRDQIARRAAVTELTVDAALTGDPDLMAQAIMADGAVAQPHKAPRSSMTCSQPMRPISHSRN